jgi:LmbE family N-acetylglucosaminyl deacetylase
LLRRPVEATPPIERDAGAPTLVLSPHADDAVLSCWSVLEDRGRDVQVVNVCTAIPEDGTTGIWDRITGAESSSVRMRERLEEDREALELAGRAGSGLGFLDLQYRDGRPLDASAVLHALAAQFPAMHEVYAPLAIGGHADHIAARDVGVELARRGFRVWLYADLPYALEFGWPAWVEGGEPAPCLDAGAYWQQCLEAVPGRAGALRPQVQALDDTAAERKLAALRCYRTQFDALDAAPLRRVSDPLWRRYEVFWETAGI